MRMLRSAMTSSVDRWGGHDGSGSDTASLVDHAADRRKFLEALEAGWSVKHAADRTTFARQRFYELRDTDEAFAAAWAEAYKAGTEALEDEARLRAVDGYDESTFDGDGELIRRVHRYSDPLMHRLLAARDPERFGTTGRVELTGPQGGPIVTEHRQGLTLEMAIELVAQRRQAAGIKTPPTLQLPSAPSSTGSP